MVILERRSIMGAVMEVMMMAMTMITLMILMMETKGMRVDSSEGESFLKRFMHLLICIYNFIREFSLSRVNFSPFTF